MHQRSHSNPNEETRRRLRVLMAGLVLGFIVLLLRLWYLQVIEGERLPRSQRAIVFAVFPNGIFEARSWIATARVLVDNRTSFTLSVLPEETPKLDLLIPRLKDQLPIRWDEVEPKLKHAYAYRTIQLVEGFDAGAGRLCGRASMGFAWRLLGRRTCAPLPVWRVERAYIGLHR